MEECEGREGAGDEVEDGVEGRGRKRDSAKVKIGAELLCKSGKVGRWDQSTEYGGVGRPCKGANRPEAGGKVGRWDQSTEYGVQITGEPGHKQVGAWLCRALVMIRRAR